MKKSHSSICSLFFIVTTSNLMMTMAGCSSAGNDIKTPFSHQNAVVKIFQKFNAQQPLVIPYLGTDIPQDIIKKSVTKQIYDTLVQKYPDIFTKAVLKQITFENTKLKPGITTAVQVTYQTINQQFYVRETSNPHPYQPIYDALATCTAQQPLLVPYLGEHPRTSSQSITYALRKSLTKRAPKILSSTVVDSIYFNDIELKPNTVKVVEATYQNNTKQIYVREATNQEFNQVFNVLKQFSQPTKPLNIGYLGSEHETDSAKTEVVTQAVKQALKKVDPVFTDQCLSKISLGDTNMIPGKAVKVSLFYRPNKIKSFYEKINIYIRENLSKLKESAKAIASKIPTGTVLHLKGFCQNQAMDTPKVTTEIRKTLVGYELLSKLEAQYVVPEHLILTGNNKYQLQIIKDGVTAGTVSITFIVEKSAVIIP